MPPLVCPSPDLIDYSFPRSVRELQKVSNALARLVEGLNDGEFTFLLTEPLRGIIRDAEYTFDWSKIALFPQLQIVYSMLSQLGLQQSGVEVIDLQTISDHTEHPIPLGCEDCSARTTWANEIGRLHLLHELSRDPRKPPFAGVGCTSAFSGSALGAYNNPQAVATLPLVGPQEITRLSDSETWEVTEEWSERTVPFSRAHANLRLLGGNVCSPTGSSHYQVRFKGERTWPLDRNFRDVPESHLRELVPIVKLEVRVIKYILLEGRWPQKIKLLRLP